MQRSAAILGAAILLGSALACGGNEKAGPEPDSEQAPAAAPAPATPASPAAAEEAAAIFETRCSTCHGPQGAGNGPASAGLTPPPRNFQDPEWQASVTDEHIAKIIRYGGAAVGRSPAMPANPDLNSKPEVVAALVERIRSLASDGSDPRQ
jgi:mono/diheme cytochrome c family protein